MRTIKEINNVISDINLSIEERVEFVKTLTEEEMRDVFVQLCSIYASIKQ